MHVQMLIHEARRQVALAPQTRSRIDGGVRGKATANEQSKRLASESTGE